MTFDQRVTAVVRAHQPCVVGRTPDPCDGRYWNREVEDDLVRLNRIERHTALKRVHTGRVELADVVGADVERAVAGDEFGIPDQLRNELTGRTRIKVDRRRSKPIRPA